MSHPIKPSQARGLRKERCLGHRVMLSRVRKRHLAGAHPSLTPAPKHHPHTECETRERGSYMGLALLTNGYQNGHPGQLGQWGDEPGHGGVNCHQVLSAQHQPETLGEHHESTGTNSAVAALPSTTSSCFSLCNSRYKLPTRAQTTLEITRPCGWGSRGAPDGPACPEVYGLAFGSSPEEGHGPWALLKREFCSSHLNLSLSPQRPSCPPWRPSEGSHQEGAAHHSGLGGRRERGPDGRRRWDQPRPCGRSREGSSLMRSESCRSRTLVLRDRWPVCCMGNRQRCQRRSDLNPRACQKRACRRESFEFTAPWSKCTHMPSASKLPSVANQITEARDKVRSP